MSALLERGRRVQEGISEFEELRRLAHAAEGFHTRAEALSGPTQQLEGLAILVEALRSREIAVRIEGIDAHNLRAQAAELAQRYDADPQSILQTDAALRFSFWQVLAQLPQRLRNALLGAWADYVERILPARQDQLLDTLQALPGFSEAVRAMRELYRQGEELRRTLPVTVEDLDAPVRLKQRLETALANIEVEGFPEEVLAFLRSATTVGAPLDALTPAVVRWLERHGLREAVRISIRAAGG